MRFDTPLIPGRYHFGFRGLGVRGDSVPSTGENGRAGFGYATVLPLLPGANADEFWFRVVAPPADAEFFFPYEDSSFEYQGPSTSFVFNVKRKGVDLGNATATITMDAGGGATLTLASNTLNSTLPDVTIVQTFNLTLASNTINSTLPNVLIEDPNAARVQSQSRTARFGGEKRIAVFNGENRTARF